MNMKTKNEATKLMIELLEDHADYIYSHSDGYLLEETAKKYFCHLVEKKIEDDLLGVLLQEVVHLVDWDDVSYALNDKRVFG